MEDDEFDYDNSVSQMRVSVRSRSDMIAYLERLAIALSSGEDLDFENETIEDYVIGLMGWIRDVEGWSALTGIDVPEHPEVWRFMAAFIHAGFYYE